MEIPHMSEWLCAICHLLGAFLLYHIYSIISWWDFKNRVKNRLWQFEIDFFQPCWGTLEAVTSKLFYFPDVKKTGAQRSDDQSETELRPRPAVLRDPTFCREHVSSCTCSPSRRTLLCQRCSLRSSSRPCLSRNGAMDVMVPACLPGKQRSTPSRSRHKSLAICYS